MGKGPFGSIADLLKILEREVKSGEIFLARGTGEHIEARLHIDVPILFHALVDDFRFSGATHGLSLEELLERHREQLTRALLYKIDDVVGAHMHAIATHGKH